MATVMCLPLTHAAFQQSRKLQNIPAFNVMNVNKKNYLISFRDKNQ